MKKILLLILIFGVTSIPQSISNPQWRNYLNSESVQTIAEEGDYLWIGSQAGMTRLNKITNEKEFFNKGNTILPTNIIFDIKVDAFGYKWIATFRGLVKFKDDDWILFDTNNSGLPKNEVRVIEIDSLGNIWVGTRGGGIGKFDGANWEAFNTTNSALPSDIINDLEFETNNILWTGTALGLARKEGNFWTIYNTSNSGLTVDNISVIKIDKNKNKWIGVIRDSHVINIGGVFKFDNNSWTNFNPTRPERIYNAIYSICIDDKNTKWIAANSYRPDYPAGIFLIDSLDLSIQPFNSIPQYWVNNILIDKQDTKWLGTDNGFLKFDQSIKRLEISNSKLGSNSVKGLQINKQTNTKYFSDYEDIPLSGTSWNYGYFSILQDTSWIFFDASNSPFWSGVYCLTSIGTGAIYAARYSGLYGDSLFLYENEVWHSVSTPFTNIEYLKYLYWDGEKLWVDFDWNGLYQYFNGVWTEVIGFPGNAVNQIINEGNTYWFACANGLVKYQDGIWNHYTSSSSNLPSDYLTSIDIDNQNNVWIGTNNGLVKSDGVNWTIFNSENSPLIYDNISSLVCDNYNKVYIGTDQGFFRKDNYDWTYFNSYNSGLPNGYFTVNGFSEDQRINALAVDNLNNIWIATNGGVGVYDEDGLPLPVELVSLSAIINNGKVQLSWVTATELNNLGFEIQRKTFLSDWITIRFKQGNGTTSQTQFYSFEDDISNIEEEKIFYRIKQVDFNGSYKFSNEIEVKTIPKHFSLEQNYPNPFNPVTKIKYSIPTTPASLPLLSKEGIEGWFVTLKVYDILGNEVATLVDEYKSAGSYEVEFDGTKLASGIYIYNLRISTNFSSKKMVVLK